MPVSGQTNNIEEQQIEEAEMQDVFVSAIAELNGYSVQGAGFGFGLAAGAGTGAAVGMKLLYSLSLSENLQSFELDVFLRFYILGRGANTGPFIQANAGAVAYFPANADTPSDQGSFTYSLSAGWRFLLGDRWFIEPYLRGGAPFVMGAGAYAGIRF